MYGIIIFLLLILATTLIAIQPLNISISVLDGYLIEFDYSFISLLLKNSKKRKKKKKRKTNVTLPILSFLRVLIRHSKIVLHKITIPFANAPHSYAVNASTIYFILLPNLISLSKSSKRFEMDCDAIAPYEFNDEFHTPEISLSLKASLFFFVYSLLIFSYEALKRKLKDVKNERKQGERNH